MFAVDEVQDSNDANGGGKFQLLAGQQVGHRLVGFLNLKQKRHKEVNSGSEPKRLTREIKRKLAYCKVQISGRKAADHQRWKVGHGEEKGAEEDHCKIVGEES